MSKDTNKVIKNMCILYVKMVFTIGLSLYTTRLVLVALGEADFGLYNLVAGIIVLLSFLNAAMSTSSQRYLSVSIGKGLLTEQKKIFANSLFLHIILAFFFIAIFAIIGLFIFDNFLNIEANRIETAKIIYHFMIISVALSFISVPFIALLNAHENMLWIASIEALEVVIKLIIAITITYYTHDKLILYSALMVGVSIISLIIYVYYCTKNYDECSLLIKKHIDNKLISKLTSFAGWNLFGAACGVGRIQGLAIILNLFLGTTINAAYSVANQVSAQMNFFSATLLRAINPQIMKNEGAGNRKRMLHLSMAASKFGYFLLAFISIPSIFEISTILHIWLDQVPQYTTIFCQLILISIMISQLTIGLQSAIQATGNIKMYQAIIGTTLLLNLPISYALLKADFPVYSVLLGYITIEILACSLRLIFLKIYAGMSIIEYSLKVFNKIILPTLFSIISCLIITSFIPASIIRTCITFSVGVAIFILTSYIWGIDINEKNYINSLVISRFKRK